MINLFAKRPENKRTSLNLIGKIKKNLPPGSFARNVLTLMTGTTFAQAIPIAISPILTRLYSPADFGLLALFVSIISVLGSIVNGRYELAIVLPAKDDEALNITFLCIMISSVVSVVLLTLVILFNSSIALRLGNPEITPWLYFVPLAVFLVGLFNSLTYYHVRIKKYKDIARATVSKSLASALAQVGLGIGLSGSVGLIIGQMVSFITGNSVLVRNVFKEKKLLKEVSLLKMKRLAGRYIEFPKFSMWSILANNLSNNLVNIFIASFFGSATLGFYSLGTRVLGTPAVLIGSSIGQVFFQKAAEERKQSGSARTIFLKTFKTLTLIGLPSFSILFIVIEDLFAIVFGDEWRIAGTYARIVLPLFFVRFVSAPLTTINSVFEKQKVSLMWQMSFLFMSICVIALATLLDIDITLFLLITTIASVFLYVILFFILLSISKGEKPIKHEV